MAESNPASESVSKPESVNVDPLADELMAMGSFEDAGAGASVPSTPHAESTHTPAATAAAIAADEVPPDLAELEALLKQAGFDDPTMLGTQGAAAGADQNDMASMLIAEARAAGDQKAGGRAPLPATSQFDLPAFQAAITESQASSIDLLRDVELNVKIELGRSRMLVEDVLKLSEGAVVELDKLAGDPVDVFVNDRLVARGEVLVLNDNFCVRVNEIVQTVKDEA